MMKFSYLIEYGGGLGPNVWDSELVIEHEEQDIRKALDKAIQILDQEVGRGSYTIYSITQED